MSVWFGKKQKVVNKKGQIEKGTRASSKRPQISHKISRGQENCWLFVWILVYWCTVDHYHLQLRTNYFGQLNNQQPCLLCEQQPPRQSSRVKVLRWNGWQKKRKKTEDVNWRLKVSRDTPSINAFMLRFFLAITSDYD